MLASHVIDERKYNRGAGESLEKFDNKPVAFLHLRWQCAPKARTISEGGSHPDRCRWVRKLTSGSAGQLAGLEPRDKGHLGWLSDPVGRNVSEA
jgi:hypothetical protein